MTMPQRPSHRATAHHQQGSVPLAGHRQCDDAEHRRAVPTRKHGDEPTGRSLLILRPGPGRATEPIIVPVVEVTPGTQPTNPPASAPPRAALPSRSRADRADCSGIRPSRHRRKQGGQARTARSGAGRAFAVHAVPDAGQGQLPVQGHEAQQAPRTAAGSVPASLRRDRFPPPLRYRSPRPCRAASRRAPSPSIALSGGRTNRLGDTLFEHAPGLTFSRRGGQHRNVDPIPDVDGGPTGIDRHEISRSFRSRHHQHHHDDDQHARGLGARRPVRGRSDRT